MEVLSHSNSAGVGILFAKDFLPISCVTEEVVEGRCWREQRHLLVGDILECMFHKNLNFS